MSCSLSRAKYNSSDAYLELMRFVGRFRFYSPFNAMLIHTQMPGAHFVCTALRWQRDYHRESSDPGDAPERLRTAPSYPLRPRPPRSRPSMTRRRLPYRFKPRPVRRAAIEADGKPVRLILVGALLGGKVFFLRGRLVLVGALSDAVRSLSGYMARSRRVGKQGRAIWSGRPVFGPEEECLKPPRPRPHSSSSCTMFFPSNPITGSESLSSWPSAPLAAT
jgi:hypothetical protein